MKQKVLEIISKITKITESDLIEQANDNRPWDSLGHVEIVIALENELGLFFETEEIADMTTINKIIEIIERKQS
jgi:acyl carrier protein